MKSQSYIHPTQGSRLRKIGRKHGFALVTALALMSFIFLLIFSMSTLTQVELATASHTKAETTAKENARLGLLVALGQLQQTAGQDQRVSARAENLGDDNFAPTYRYYTGVWDTENMSNQPQWLVSGSINDIENAQIATPMTLLSADLVGADNEVVVDAEEVFDENGVLSGLYGYWVSDQSLKADISIGGGYDLDWIADTNERYAAQQQTMLRTGVEAIIEDETFDQSSSTTVSELGRLLDISDSRHVHSGFQTTALNHFHDLAVGNYSLLTDTVNGGLKTNLSVNTAIDASSSNPFINGDLVEYFDTSRSMKDFTALNKNFTGVNAEIHNPDLANNTMPSDGEYYGEFTPIVTEAAAYVAVFQRKKSSSSDEFTPAMRFYLDVELYNPYPFPILLDSTQAHGLELRMNNLPEIKITNQSTGRNTGWVNINRLSRSGGRGIGSWLTIDDNANAYNYNNRKTFMLPGEVYRLEDPDPSVQAQGLWLDMSSYDIGEVEESHRILVEGRSPDQTGTFNIQLIQRSPDGNVPGRTSGLKLLSEITNIPYVSQEDAARSVAFEYRFSQAKNNLDGPDYWMGNGFSADVDVKTSYIMAFHYRIDDNWDSNDIVDLVKNVDLRMPEIDLNDTFTDESGTTHNFSDYFVGTDNPVEANTSVSGKFDDNDLFSDPDVRERHYDIYNSVRLYDHPNREPQSIAAARYLNLVGRPTNIIGSPRGSDLNHAFDEYYFTSVPTDINSWDPGTDQLPNPRMIYSPESATPTTSLRNANLADTVAQDFRIRGGFNINSLSIAAWQTVLSQDLNGAYEWEYENESGTNDDKELSNVFFSHPFSANHYAVEPLTDSEATGGSYLSAFDTNSDAQQRLYRQGFRALDLESTDPTVPNDLGNLQIKQLAWHITDISKQAQEQQGHPFASLAEFTSYQDDTIAPRGIIQTAIDNVGPQIDDVDNDIVIAEVQPINENIPEISPLYLSQQTVIGAISNIMTARGDTFLIRTCGIAVDPLSKEVVAQVYLEAVAQREYGASITDTDPRPFKIVSFRWLDSSDI